MELQKALKFLEHFSIITIGDNKVPNHQWKNQQEIKLTNAEFTSHFNNVTTKGFGIVTGFEDLEVIDVDLKVLSTAQEQRDFWDEFYGLLKDNILDFEDKFAVYKTKNSGYHILYKTKRVQGNLKIAKLKGHNEAIIESRGRGGYVFAYPENKVGKLSYFQIQYVSDADREVLIHICEMYNYVEQKPEPVKIEVKKEFNGNKLSPWQDFNNRNDIWDLIQDEFTIPTRGNKSKHILVKRFGATSAHSGYIFKDTGCLYLFSTGTRYPAQILLSPFAIYAHQHHGGDMSAAASDLYKQGYGDRAEKKVKELEKSIPDISEYDITDVSFPIDIYPKSLQSYLKECELKLDANIDFTGSALLWLISVCVGNSYVIEVKRGWTENATVWISLVGKAGIGKTPAINKVIFPLENINLKETKKYAKEYAKWKEYDALGKKERESVPEVEKPKKTQFIANDITVEALVDLHQESDNAVGVFKDELAGWLKDMNKYRAGSDLEFWLSAWSGKSVFLNRITRESSFVDKPFIPVLGGIQPSILSNFYTEENKENGFMDRMLLSFPEAQIDVYNENELDEKILTWYNEQMTMFFNFCKRNTEYDDDGVIRSRKAKLSPEAKAEWIKIFNEITNTQNSDDENEYLKSMYPKQKSYIPRFALLINIIHAHFGIGSYDLISGESMRKAKQLSDYFVNCAKKVRMDNVVVTEMKKVIKDGKTNADKIRLLYEQNQNFNRTKAADRLGVSVRYVRQIVKEIK